MATDISTDAGHGVRQALACRSFVDKLLGQRENQITTVRGLSARAESFFGYRLVAAPLPYPSQREGNLLNQKFVGHSHRTLLLTLLIFFNSCAGTSTGSAPPVSAGALLREYRQSSAWVRQKYDGKEISVRGLVMSAIVLPVDKGEQGTVWLKESESETSGKVGCWFSNQQAAEFSKISSGQYLTIKGVFNGEAGVDLKFCRLVKVE